MMKTINLRQPCILCGNSCQHSFCLCIACLDELPYIDSACTACGLPLDTSARSDICGACISSPPPILQRRQTGSTEKVGNAGDVVENAVENAVKRTGQCISLLHYESPVDYLIKRMKYHNQLSVAELLGKLIAKKIKQYNAPLPELLIPIPLHVDRLRQRGYNQAAEIAKAVSRDLRIPLNLTACSRIKSTIPQFDLPASERGNNIKNAFAASKQIQTKHIALIDDVMTTGSTVWEVANILLESGASQVDVWVCARATTN